MAIYLSDLAVPTLLRLDIHTDRQSSKSSFASSSAKEWSSKSGEDAIASTQTGTTKSFDWSVGRRLYIPDHPTNHKYRMVGRKGCL